jgi:hypothetical protein
MAEHEDRAREAARDVDEMEERSERLEEDPPPEATYPTKGQ